MKLQEFSGVDWKKFRNIARFLSTNHSKNTKFRHRLWLAANRGIKDIKKDVPLGNHPGLRPPFPP